MMKLRNRSYVKYSTYALIAAFMVSMTPAGAMADISAGGAPVGTGDVEITGTTTVTGTLDASGATEVRLGTTVATELLVGAGSGADINVGEALNKLGDVLGADYKNPTFNTLTATGETTLGATTADSLTIGGTDIGATVATNTGDIATLRTDTDTLRTDVGTLRTDVNNNAANIAANTTQIAANTTQIATNTGDIGVLRTDVDTLRVDTNTLRTDVNNNTAEIGKIGTVLGADYKNPEFDSLKVTGETTLGGALTANAGAAVTGGLTADTADVTGDATVGGNLDVTGDLSAANGTFGTKVEVGMAGNNTVIENGTVTATGLGKFGSLEAGSAEFSGLKVNGATDLNGALDVNGNVDATGTIHAAGNISTDGNISAVNGTFSGDVSAKDGTFTGTMTAQDAVINNNLNVGNDATIDGKLSAGAGNVVADSSGLTVGNKVTVGAPGSQTTIENGDITTDGALTADRGDFATEVTVGADTTIGDGEATFGAAGNQTAINGGDISAVNGTFTGKVEAAEGVFSDSISVAGNLTANAEGMNVNNANITNDLTVGNNASIGNQLTIGKDADGNALTTIENGDITTNGTLTADRGDFATEVTVGANTTIGDGEATFGAAGNQTVINGGDISAVNGTFTGKVEAAEGVFSDSISVAGNLTANAEGMNVNNANITNDLTVGNNASIGNQLTIGKDADGNALTTIENGDITTAGNVGIGGTLDVTGNTTLGGTLNGAGDATFASNAAVEGNFDVAGTTTLGGKLTANGGALINNGLEVNGDAAFNDNATIEKNLTVKGESSLEGKVTIGTGANQTIIDGDTVYTGTVNTGTVNTDFANVDEKLTVGTAEGNQTFVEGSKITSEAGVQGTTVIDGGKLTVSKPVTTRTPGDDKTEIDGGNITATGKGTFGSLQVNGNANIGGDATVDGKLYAKEGGVFSNSTVINGDGMEISENGTIAAYYGKYGMQVGGLTYDGMRNTLNVGGGTITGLADGGVYRGSSDAVTGNQLWQAYQRMDDLQESINIVGAHAAALSGLAPVPYNPYQPTTLSAAIGTYRDEYAVAVGVYHYVRDNVMFNLGASICSDGDLMGRAGISFAVGKKDKDKPALAQNMNDVQKQLMEVQYALQELKDENAALKKQLRKQ